MKNSIDVKWDSDMKFDAEIDGHVITVDAGGAVGGHNLGPRPKSLLILALGGCTGMDVMSILKKMKVEVTWFNVKIEYELKDEHPMKFEKMNVIYEIKGPDIEFEKVKKAVDLSIERYCGVYATLKEAVEMNHEIRILPD